MEKEIDTKQFWKLFQSLPEKVKEAFLSEESGDTILEIGKRNGIEEEKISEISKYVGYVLLGLLPLVDFQKTLEEELNIEKEKIEKVAKEINRFIFYPIKSELEEMYKVGMVSKRKRMLPPEEIVSEEIKEGTKPSPQDIYREPIE